MMREHDRNRSKIKIIPTEILIVSALQLMFHYIQNSELSNTLQFEPDKFGEIWRMVTYMLLHEDWEHLLINIFIQIVSAPLLAYRHSGFRALLVYIIGGMTGALGASCFSSLKVIGASGGVCALMASNISHLFKNSENLICQIIIITGNVVVLIFSCWPTKGSPISWGAHLFGAIAGFFLGLIFYKNTDEGSNNKLNVIGLLLYLFLFIGLAIVNYIVRLEENLIGAIFFLNLCLVVVIIVLALMPTNQSTNQRTMDAEETEESNTSWQAHLKKGVKGFLRGLSFTNDVMGEYKTTQGFKV